MINLRLVNVVWGEAYTDTFANVCLPSTLSADNLEFIAANSHSSYRIYTTPKDAEVILNSPAGKKLSALMPVEMCRLDAAFPLDDPNAPTTSPKIYKAMSLCHTHFIKTVAKEDAAMVFLSPDLFCADGLLRRLFEIAQSGKRLVMMSALRLAKESFIASLKQHYTKEGALQSIGKRELVDLAMSHLHPETESLVWGSNTSNVWPSIMLWKIPHEGLINRSFHLHPLMVRPILQEVLPNGTLDDDYVARSCPNPADEYIVQDSDDMVAFELSRRTARANSFTHREHNIARVADWARAHANPRHQKFAQTLIRLHSSALSETWREFEERSNKVVQDIQARLSQTVTATTP